MPATHTPTEPTRSRGGVIALIVVGVVVVFLVVGVALAAVLGLFVVTASGDQSPPVVVEEPVSAPLPIPDGEMFGFVTAVDAASVTFDPARMLSGQEAREAAHRRRSDRLRRGHTQRLLHRQPRRRPPRPPGGRRPATHRAHLRLRWRHHRDGHHPLRAGGGLLRRLPGGGGSTAWWPGSFP